MRRWRIGLVCAVGMVLAVLTAARVHVWGDERALWAEAVSRAPLKPRPWVNLGRQYQLHGQALLAADAYREALRVAQRPGRAMDERIATEAIALINLSVLRSDRGLAVSAMQLLGREPDVVLRHAWVTRGLSR